MHVRHYSYLLNVRGASEALNCLRHVVIHWCSQPGSHRGKRGSLIVASVPKHRNKRQFRCPFAGNGHGHLRAETRTSSAKRTHCIGDMVAARDEHMHQETSAVRSRGNFLDEQTADAIARTAICEGKIQRSLYLPAELLRLPLHLPTCREIFGLTSVQRFREVWIHELCFSTTAILLFHNGSLLRARARGRQVH